tara:strand:+ start:33 stop:185 length:153 start_codon:yes stop_codon:yes gene_type:complete
MSGSIVCCHGTGTACLYKATWAAIRKCGSGGIIQVFTNYISATLTQSPCL